MPRNVRNLKALVALLAAVCAYPASAAELNHAREYARCMALAPDDPDEAFEMATAWQALGGGDAAAHCAALALLYDGQPEFAARRLEILADTMVAEPEFKGQVLSQAGQAWLLHGDAARAEAALTAAVGLLRERPEVMVDRAQARFAMTDYQGALDDLTAALAADPEAVDAYVFRATALRFLDRTDEALSDIEIALTLDAAHPAALLERGILRRLAGDDGAARADWLKVLELEPDGAAAAMARTNIERMDVTVEGN